MGHHNTQLLPVQPSEGVKVPRWHRTLRALKPPREPVLRPLFRGQAVRPKVFLEPLLAVAPEVGVVRPRAQKLKVREQKPRHAAHQPPLRQLPRQVFADRVAEA